MEIITTQKYIHTSPRKLRLVADLVRSMKPAQALVTLQFAKQAASKPLGKVIESVLANARVQNLDVDKLNFKSLEINEGPKLKRYHAQARGRSNPYKKRMSHIKIVLSDDLTQNSKFKSQKLNNKKEEHGTEN